jgi:hypothetical protein
MDSYFSSVPAKLNAAIVGHRRVIWDGKISGIRARMLGD